MMFRLAACAFGVWAIYQIALAVNGRFSQVLAQLAGL